LRESLRKSNCPPLTGNPEWGRRLKHGYWTLKSVSKSTAIPTI